MKRLAACLVLAILTQGGGASAQGGPEARPGQRADGPVSAARRGYANPSAVIAAELAFARLAQEKGQWTAFRETAAPDAIMFAPQMVVAQIWLKNRANPPVAVRWRPHRVWSSCDGSLMVSTGSWTKGAESGWFTTLWQRQDDGAYKWIVDHGAPLAQSLPDPDMIDGHVAECPPRAPGEIRPAPLLGKAGKPKKAKRIKPEDVALDPAGRSGRSRDGSLVWAVTAGPDGAHRLIVKIWQDGDMRVIRDEPVAAGS